MCGASSAGGGTEKGSGAKKDQMLRASCSCREKSRLVLMSVLMYTVDAEEKNGNTFPSPPLSGLFAHASSICNCSSPCGPHNEISMTPERQFEKWQT